MRFCCNKKYFFFLLPMIFIHLGLCGQMQKADSLKKVLTFKADTSRIPILLDLSSAYMQFSRVKAMDAALEAKTLAAQYENDFWLAKSLYTIANIQVRNGDYTESVNGFNQAAAIFQKLGNTNEYINTLNSLSTTFQYKGDFNQALNSSFDAFKASEKVDYKKGMASALLNSGNVYRSMQNYNKAILDFEKALALSTDEGDEMAEANELNSISNIYGDKGDNDKAIEYLERSLAIYTKARNQYLIAVGLNNLGATYVDMGINLDKAHISKQDSLLVIEYYEKALDYLNQSFELRKKLGDKKGMVSALTNIGTIWYYRNKMDKAIEYFKQAYEISHEIGAEENELSILYNISDSYRVMKQFDSAFIYARKYSDLNDSVFHKNLAEKISEMQARFGVEKAEGEARATQKEKKLITIASIAGGVLLLVIVLFLWNRAVTRKRVNTKLSLQKEEIQKKNSELHEANIEIESKNKDITDSIQYARKIQEAILPELEFKATFGDTAFVLYRPKDIVSGDFYWMEQKDDYLLFAAVDCTGHGVPGAFVSIVCSNLLSQSVNEHGLIKPHDILNDVNIRLSETLRQRQDESRVRDGMDIALCCVNKKTKQLYFAGAFNPAWIIRDKKIIELLPDKFPVGLFEEEVLRKFTLKEMQLETGDRIIIFSDGYSDQFGGELGKKYKRSTFHNFISGIQSTPIKDQGKLLLEEHLCWRGENEQVDDILVLGVEI
ncbi:hypothetical protein BH09BAC5_BH09BAC5_04920 [soil metagenome]